jgi:hypothetical protein
MPMALTHTKTTWAMPPMAPQTCASLQGSPSVHGVESILHENVCYIHHEIANNCCHIL